jgi:hypothetical protein
LLSSISRTRIYRTFCLVVSWQSRSLMS